MAYGDTVWTPDIETKIEGLNNDLATYPPQIRAATEEVLSILGTPAMAAYEATTAGASIGAGMRQDCAYLDEASRIMDRSVQNTFTHLEKSRYTNSQEVYRG